MPDRRQHFGDLGEATAVRHLKKHGYRILERNYRTPLGEIDIIATQKDTLVFVEVKARRTDRYGHPKEAVTPAKQRKISMVALHYLKKTRQQHRKARFDVVSILTLENESEIEIVKNAFELAYS